MDVRIHQKKIQLSSLTRRPPSGSLYYTKEISEKERELLNVTISKLEALKPIQKLFYAIGLPSLSRNASFDTHNAILKNDIRQLAFPSNMVFL